MERMTQCDMDILEKMFDAVDACVAVRDWEGLGQELRLLSNSSGAYAYTITLREHPGPPRFDVLFATNSEFADEYVNGEGHRLSRISEFQLADMRSSRRSDFLPDAEYRKTEYHARFCRRFDVFHHMIANTLMTPRSAFCLVLTRSEDDGDFDEADLRRMTLVMRYLRIFAKSETFAQSLTAGEGLAEYFPGPAAVIGDGREVISMNAAFEKAAPAFASRPPRTGQELMLASRLARNAALACERLNADRGEMRKVDVNLGGFGTLQIIPLRPFLGEGAAPRWLWLVFPRADVEDVVGRFRRECGLTRSESDILLALAQGRSLREIAVSSSRSYGTVRWHTQNMLEKASVGTQKDLIAKFYQDVNSW